MLSLSRVHRYTGHLGQHPPELGCKDQIIRYLGFGIGVSEN